MRRMLYLGLTEALKELKYESGQPLIRHIDLWNEQVEFIEQEEPFDTPAVFIEFRPVQWRTLGGTTQQADVPFRLHVVTKWKGSARDGSMFQEESLERFDLLDKIDAHLFNFFLSVRNESVCMTRRTGSSTNHNHEELVEDISDFTCQVTQTY